MNDKLTKTYVSAAIRYFAALGSGDSSEANNAHDEMVKLVRFWRSFDDGGRAVLTHLAGSADPRISLCAATHLLPLERGVALRSLEKTKDSQHIEAAYQAKMVLQELALGDLDPDWFMRRT